MSTHFVVLLSHLRSDNDVHGLLWIWFFAVGFVVNPQIYCIKSRKRKRDESADASLTQCAPDQKRRRIQKYSEHMNYKPAPHKVSFNVELHWVNLVAIYSVESILLREALFTSESVKLGHVRACVSALVRIIIDFCEGDMKGKRCWTLAVWIMNFDGSEKNWKKTFKNSD